MATSGGPDIERDGLVLSLDGASRRSTLKATQVNNILPDPGNWSTGTGGQSGYGSNGSSSEQNRVSVTNDPWGRNSITWRTTPDSTSGADGGWNSSYYSIDTNYTYRYSMWVRRYTSGTGGTFYMGMNPNPIRNDNGASQGNPYFTYPSIASLTQNQWYLVVAHVFHEGYTGGRHPESGWYENGVKISDKSYGNVGSLDVRWASGTTSARHRAYHYYTTNVNSGIEFAYPRVDKIDGKEPSISEMINRGESGWLNLVGDGNGEVDNGLQYASKGVESSFNFDGTDDSIDLGTEEPFTLLNKTATWEAVVKFDSSNANGAIITRWENGVGQTWWFGRYNANRIHLALILGGGYNAFYSDSSMTNTTKYYHIAAVLNGTSLKFFLDGELNGNRTVNTNTWDTNPSGTHSTRIGAQNGGSASLHNGEIPIVKLYDRALSADEIQQNYNAYKNRFNM